MLNADSDSEEPEADDQAVDGIVRTGGRGALALAIHCDGDRPCLWLGFYLLRVFATHCAMSQLAPPDRTGSHDAAARAERRWSLASIGIVVLLVFLATFAGVHQVIMPQVRMETVDPRTLHVTGEFIESNLGSAVERDGSVTVRLVGQQYSFTPQCIVVPTDTPITYSRHERRCRPWLDIEHTNINTMLIPGYIATLNTRFTNPRTLHAVPRVLRHRSPRDVGARADHREGDFHEAAPPTRRRLTCVAQ